MSKIDDLLKSLSDPYDDLRFGEEFGPPRPVRHIVALSGGKDSTAMALRLRELYPEINFEWVCTPTGRELPEMVAHWVMLGELLGSRIVAITNGLGFVGTCREHNALPNWRMRFCTPQMKIIPFQQYAFLAAPAVVYVGLRADEETREGATGYGDPGGEVYGAVTGVAQRFPMREWGWGVADVWSYLESKGISIPARTDCDVCFFQRILEWWNLWRNHPARWMQGEAMEEEFGFTFRSPGRDTWPASMKELRLLFESGQWPKGAGQEALINDTNSQQCRVCRI